MKNWGGNIKWNPTTIAYPSTEEEIQKLVLKAANERKKIRVIGTGHSFTAVCKTDDILISLDKYQGLVNVDKEKVQATVKGGTKLNTLGGLLFQEGMAMENLGDIDVQSIAGTISTGTHGTGKKFGTISTQVIALRFINGKGEIITCSTSENQDLFKAAQVSLGMLGIITEVTLQCVPMYKLALEIKKEPVDAVFTNLQQRLANNRNFEFYWFPYTDTTLAKTTNQVEDTDVDKVNFFNYWTEYVLENYAFKVLCEYGNLFPSKAAAISRFSAKAVSDVKKVAHSHKVYATQRMVRFVEMEYNIPSEAFPDAWKDITKAFEKKQFHVHFPLEVRWVRQDDIYLSPAYDRNATYIACHVYNKKEYKAYFKVLEEIFRAYDGRPHWGKMHTLTPSEIASKYPKLESFLQCRKIHDPDGGFTSTYISQLFGF